MRDEVDGKAHAHFALVARRCHHAPRFIVQGEQLLSRSEQTLTVGRQRNALVLALKQGDLEMLFEPLDLLAHGSLRAIEQTGSAGHAARLGNRHEGAQDGRVDVFVHGGPGSHEGVIAE